jgi:hypothetical protein
MNNRRGHHVDLIIRDEAVDISDEKMNKFEKYIEENPTTDDSKLIELTNKINNERKSDKKAFQNINKNVDKMNKKIKRMNL